MDLNFKNVARCFSEIVTRKERVTDVNLRKAKSVDAFSIVYSICMVNSEIRIRGEQREKIKKENPSQPEGITPSTWVSFPPFIDHRDVIIGYGYDPSLDFKFDKTYRIFVSTDIELIIESILKVLNNSRIAIDIPGVHEHIPEILHNAKVHPVEPSYFLRGHYSEKFKYLDIVVADIGLGIKGTLSKKCEYSYLTDKPALFSIMKAFEPLVTSKNEIRGTGLSEAHDYFLEHKENTMFLSSNDGYYLIEHENGEPVISAGNLKYNLNGVQVLLRFGCEK